MPIWLYDIILSNKEKPKKHIKEVISPVIEEQKPEEIIINKDENITIQLLNCLDNKRFHVYSDWIKMAAVF